MQTAYFLVTFKDGSTKSYRMPSSKSGVMYNMVVDNGKLGYEETTWSVLMEKHRKGDVEIEIKQGDF